MERLTRRSVIAGMAGTVAGGGLAGGCPGPIKPIDLDGNLTDPKTPLTIDVHSHVFNGSDLQVARFFTKVVALERDELKVFGPLIDALGNFAPSVQDEGEALKALARAATTPQRLGEERYQVARTQLARAYRETYGPGAPRSAAALPPTVDMSPAQVRQNLAVRELGQQIENLPGNSGAYRDGRKVPTVAASPLGITVDGALTFLMRNFQYRYVNVHDYLHEYSAGKTRKIDLMVTSVVDYDWPLGSSEGTRSSLAEQVCMNEQISRLTRGWVHSHAPFCPFKQVAFWQGLTREDPMALVQDAVLNRGHIGVKIYPPMGFRPLNNAGLPANFWEESPLEPRLKRPDLGANLDAALRVLYTWCTANDVPIMAHTAPSNVTMAKSKEEIMAPACWAPLVENEEFAGLRVNFAHFGHTDIAHDAGVAARGLMKYMRVDPTANGRGCYADSGFFAEILSEGGAVQEQLQALFAEPTMPNLAPLRERLMYGSDWEMVTIEGKATTDYLKRFQAVFDNLDPEGGLGDRFFGVNAANHLGLRRGQATRTRLDAFHRGSPKPPAWMAKVDALI
jgi:hypothetical protein